MTPNDALFNDYGGILYAVSGIHNLTSKNAQNRPALFFWILYCEAIARSEKSSDVYDWIKYQLSLINKDYPNFSDQVDKNISNSWIPGLVLNLFSKDFSPEKLGEVAPLEKNQQISVELVSHLIRSQGKSLFSPENWGDEIKDARRYQDPFSCAIVKLGILLKKLLSVENDPKGSIYHSWKEFLREHVLHELPIHSLPQFDTVEIDHNFLKLIKSLWMTAELLASPSRVNVLEKIEKNGHRFDDDELILIGALYGWIKGYKTTANWVRDRNQRSYLSSLALRLSIQHENIRITSTGLDPIIFFSTKDGDRLSYEKPFCNISKIDTVIEFDDLFHTRKQTRLSLRLRNAPFSFAFNLIN